MQKQSFKGLAPIVCFYLNRNYLQNAGVNVDSLLKVLREELIARIQNRKSQPLMIWDGRPRLSLAGVQEKLAVAVRDGEFGFGDGDIASTHILKFGNERVSHLVINEFFCMHLARAVGLDVATCELVEPLYLYTAMPSPSEGATASAALGVFQSGHWQL